jgi:exonuclease SbcC
VILRELRIRLMPGVDAFTLHAAPGLNLIVGPNGSGKSTICRAVRALLWPDRESPSPLALESRWQDGSRELFAERRDGRPTRWQQDGQEVSPPHLPAGHLADCYRLGILDLLKPGADATDGALAAEILTQMAGGYDLAALSRLFPIPRNPGLAERKRLNHRQGELEQLRLQEEQLTQDEEELPRLLADLAAAREAGARVTQWRQLQELEEQRAHRDRVRAEIAAFPPGMERLQGNELEVLAQLDGDLVALADEEQVQRRRLTGAQAVIQATELPPGAPDEIELLAWRERLQGLGETERALAQAQDAAAGKAAYKEAAAAGLAQAWHLEAEALLAPETMRDAERLLQQLSANAWHRQGLIIACDRLRAERRDVDRSGERLEQAAQALEAWLAVPESGTWGAAWLVTLLPALLAAAAGLGLLLSGHGTGWWPLGAGLLGAGLFLVLVWRPWRRGRGPARRDWQQAFAASGLPEPEPWSVEAVGRRLRELHGEVAGAQLLRLRDDLAEHLAAEIRRLEQTSADLAAEREDLVQRIGADPAVGPVELLAFAQRVQAWLAARAAHAGAEAQAEHLRDQLGAGLQTIQALLAELGRPDVPDATAARLAVEDLLDRTRRLKDARRTLAESQADLMRVAARAASLRERRGAIFTRAGLAEGDRAGLQERLSRLASWQRCGQEHDHLERTVRELLAALHAKPLVERNPELLELSPVTIAGRLAEDEAAAAASESRHARIEVIRDRIAKARRGAATAEALAAVQTARDELRARREESLRNAAGALLLERLGERYQRASQPAVLERAAELFGEFTAHLYDLQLDRSSGEAAFRARDARTGQALRLSELSDGTRAQLLLATRLAFIDTAEAGARPPLLLDEALTGSDPERFHAIATSLLTLARAEDRQLFYLTADPADLVAWQRAVRDAELSPVDPIDLLELRGRERRAAPGDLRILPLSRVPAPLDLTPEAYGLTLAVPRFDPRLEAGLTHLFHLLRDDLPLLHRLLQAHLSTAGQWRRGRRAALAGGLLDQDAAARLDARVHALKTFVDAWRIGRGRPVDHHALAASGAVSGTFLDRVTELAEQLAGDGSALLAGLRAGQVSHFHRDKIDVLEEYLTAEGHLDPRPPLDEPAVRERVFAALEQELAAGAVSLEVMARLSHELWEAAG